MNVNMTSKTLWRIYMILACILIWIIYTYMITQLLKSNSSTTDAKKLDFAQEMHEIDQRASVCFKDVIPFSIPLIQGSEICQNKPDLLIMIHTEADDFKIRNAYRNEFVNRIRNTSAKYDFSVDVVYLMGLNKHYCILAKNVEEIIIHKDILVGSFIDDYYNQTLKSITMLEWFVKYCKSASVLLKMNDRMDPATSMETDEFYSLIRDVRDKDKLLMGSINDIEITTHHRIPWISLPYLYPGLPRNLHFNYLLSRDSAENLLKAYADTIYIAVWKEDLYITGVLANIAKVKIAHNKNFLIKCITKACLFCSCGTSITNNSIPESPSTSTENSTQFTSDKLIHSIPKRDTQAASQIYSSQPFTTITNPTTIQTNDKKSTYFSTQYTTGGNPSVNFDFTTITTQMTEKSETYFNLGYTYTSASSYTTTTQLAERDDVSTTETSTTNTLGTTPHFQPETEKTEQSTSTTNEYTSTSVTKGTHYTTESLTEHTATNAPISTTVVNNPPTTQDVEVISEVISVTDIEFALGFEELFQDGQIIADTISTQDTYTPPNLQLNYTGFHDDKSMANNESESLEVTISTTVAENFAKTERIDSANLSTRRMPTITAEKLGNSTSLLVEELDYVFKSNQTTIDTHSSYETLENGTNEYNFATLTNPTLNGSSTTTRLQD